MSDCRPDTAYRSLANELRKAILADRFSNGARLPTEAELARDRGVSRQTVRSAFHDLVTEGLVYPVPGRGTFASDRGGSTRVFLPQDVGELLLDAPELTQTGLSTTATVIGLIDAAADLPITGEQNISVAPLPGEVAGHLRVPSDVAVLRIDRTYFDSAGTAVELAISHFLPDHYSYRVRLHRSMH